MSSCRQDFLDADKDFSIFIDRCRISLQRSATVSGRLSIAQIENEAMKRADHFFSADQTIRERSAFVRAGGLGGKNVSVSRMKHRDRHAADLKHAAFASWNFCQLPQVDDETAELC